ncbi:MAG: response regulator [Patescibacteria group bacterium]|nr:response regulator [Patescibacteria group bacterium]
MATTKKKILIIEDEKPMARALELKLTHAGFEVKAVFNGEEGIKLLQEETYALILLDLVMPNVDGFMVLEILKEKKIKTPVMVLTNLSQDKDEERTKALGAKEFFIKSNTTIATIVEKVIKLLE